VREVGGGDLFIKNGQNGFFFPNQGEFILANDLGYNHLIGGFYRLSEFPTVENKLAAERLKWEAGDHDVPPRSVQEIQKAWEQWLKDQHSL
jgi:hypothetical protein